MLIDERREELKAAALAWCNERRAEKGMEPIAELPKGIQKDSESCPCGKATGLSVGRVAYCEANPKWEAKTFELPSVVGNFVDAFDNGDIPELIEARK